MLVSDRVDQMTMHELRGRVRELEQELESTRQVGRRASEERSSQREEWENTHRTELTDLRNQLNDAADRIREERQKVRLARAQTVHERDLRYIAESRGDQALRQREQLERGLAAVLHAHAALLHQGMVVVAAIPSLQPGTICPWCNQQEHEVGCAIAGFLRNTTGAEPETMREYMDRQDAAGDGEDE